MVAERFILSDEIRAEWDNRIHPTMQTNIYQGLKAPEDVGDAELLKECQDQKAADALLQVEAAKYRLKNAEYSLDWSQNSAEHWQIENQNAVKFAVEKVAKAIDTHRYHKNAASAYWYYLQ